MTNHLDVEIPKEEWATTTLEEAQNLIDFRNEINYLIDEGFIEMKDEDGVIKFYERT